MLPEDIKEAIDNYQRDCDDGTIKFGSDGFATDYPGHDEAEVQLFDFVESKVVDHF